MRTILPIGRSQLIERHGSVYGLKLGNLNRLPQGNPNFIRIVLGTYSRNYRPQTTYRYIDPSHFSIIFLPGLRQKACQKHILLIIRQIEIFKVFDNEQCVRF